VEVLATVAGPDDAAAGGVSTAQPVLCRQGRVLAAAFHPELSDDLRLHQLFLED
jgi:5'-phosphate synthase pdxT subunit